MAAGEVTGTWTLLPVVIFSLSVNERLVLVCKNKWENWSRSLLFGERPQWQHFQSMDGRVEKTGRFFLTLPAPVSGPKSTLLCSKTRGKMKDRGMKWKESEGGRDTDSPENKQRGSKQTLAVLHLLLSLLCCQTNNKQHDISTESIQRACTQGDDDQAITQK